MRRNVEMEWVGGEALGLHVIRCHTFLVPQGGQ